MEELPRDLHKLLLSYLNYNDIKAMLSLNNYWKELPDNMFWKQLFELHFESYPFTSPDLNWKLLYKHRTNYSEYYGTTVKHVGTVINHSNHEIVKDGGGHRRYLKNYRDLTSQSVNGTIKITVGSDFRFTEEKVIYLLNKVTATSTKDYFYAISNRGVLSRGTRGTIGRRYRLKRYSHQFPVKLIDIVASGESIGGIDVTNTFYLMDEDGRVTVPYSFKVAQIWSNDYYYYLLTSDGDLYNSDHQLLASNIMTMDTYVLESGHEILVVVTTKGAVYAKGPNEKGELNLGHRKPVTTLTLLPIYEAILKIKIRPYDNTYGLIYIDEDFGYHEMSNSGSKRLTSIDGLRRFKGFVFDMTYSGGVTHLIA